MRQILCGAAAALCLLAVGAASAAPVQNLPQLDGRRALEYTRQFVAIGPRWIGSPGHAKAEAFLKDHFRHDALEEDTFTAKTPAGSMQMHNFIVRFPGKKDGVIVFATHYETNYWLRNVNFVGANDGGSTTGLLLAMADWLRAHPPQGYSVWLVFFDGEESIQPQWSDSDALYGSRHLAEKWQGDGTLKRVKALILADMLGDKDLDIDRDQNSTGWLEDLVRNAASKYGYQSYFFARDNQVDDDHMPFVHRGVPCADIIDIDYGYENSFHHTVEDTMDKLSAESLTISGDAFLESISLLNQR
ncbi:M28 family peptidase [Paracidobacterium acidisoli]|uniref:Peptidase M28 n=1 Tax=Paracidobacterium acidisoli TaxID=2303751 RepID=A0A372IKM8_9BACT|nr:M28 family peptidase [Paracidobacterium acidisoli]MBT9332848.1 M28 family peptidase [Paracidobacterium acidisoli]